jgi:hypothetical protein
MQYQQQVVNKPTAAYVLSLIGGIFGIIASIIFFIIGAAIYSEYINSYYYYSYSSAFALWFGLGIWCIITSIIVLVSAAKLNSSPLEHTKWGVLILVFSIIGLGTLFGFIGGILALAYKPQFAGQQTMGWGQPVVSPMQSVTRICPKCGRVINENTKFCPYCGNSLG